MTLRILAFGIMLFTALLAFESCSTDASAKKTRKLLTPFETDLTVAILPYKLEGEMKSAAARAEELLSESNFFSLIDRSRMEDIMKEHSFQNSDWASQDVVAQIGKALNAQFIAYIDEKDVKTVQDGHYMFAEYYHAYFVNLSLVNVSTFRKFTFAVPDKRELHYTRLDGYYTLNADILINMFNDNMHFPVDTLNGTWYFDGVKESSAVYKVDTLDYISPFASEYPLTPVKSKGFALFANIETAELNSGKLVLTLEDGSKLQNEDAIIKEKKAKIVNVALKDDVGIKPYSTCAIGTLRARYSKDFDINGTVFYKDDTLAIQIGTSKDDGTGKAYFLMFSR